MRRRSSGQLTLHLIAEAPGEWMECRGLFSSSYLRNHVTRADFFPNPEIATERYERIKTLWIENYQSLWRQSERYTCSAFLEPALKILGWRLLPEKALPLGQFAKKRPDFCLYADEDEFQKAALTNDHSIVYGNAATVLEAKKVNHPLDRVSRKDTPGWFPSQQIQDYLRNAKDALGKRHFNWAILTNGREWRLYCEQAATDATFVFHLVRGTAFCTPNDFLFFLTMFSPEAFQRNAQGRCRLDDLREESIHLQTTIETRLRKRIIDVLEDLANGFHDHEGNAIESDQFGALYDNALIFLYRLLFVLYAESRDLLPAKPSGPGANARYRETYSLARLVDRLRDKSHFDSDAFETLYEHMLKLFHLINGDRKAQNIACGVTQYNGGLFNPLAYPLLEKWRIGDKTLANVLRQLVFAQPSTRPSVRQMKISTEETIDYGTLEVRQLGDIYEGLLGAHLAAENGRLVLKNEKGQNHRQGIFYTPDWVVRFLVRESLQPLLAEIESRPEVQTALHAKSEEKKRDNSFAHAVLQLNVVDPAMGSGHFLVRATEWLAQRIFEHPTTRRMTEQIVPSGKSKRTRADILKAGLIPVSQSLSQEQAEIAYWRRRVVEACIYGVDLNPLAVELTKLSLWLTCIATDEPLNFLDHHLCCGNSLLQAHADELHQPPLPATGEAKSATLDIASYLTKTLKEVISTNVNIEETASTEMEVIKKKELRWKAVRARLDPFVTAADLWLASLNGLPITDFDYAVLVRSMVSPETLTDEERKHAGKLHRSLDNSLAAFKNDQRPFHWELEFPTVFFEELGTPRPTSMRGFDAVFGNPPYISTHTSSEQAWRKVLEHRAGYLEDLYVHFSDLGFQLLRPGGTFGFIVSDTFFTLASKMRMRQLLHDNSILYLGQCDPFEATVDVAIFVAAKGKPGEDHNLVFIQARPRKGDQTERGRPEEDLPGFALTPDFLWNDGTTQVSRPKCTVTHAADKSLRLHRVPAELYRASHKQVFFEPRHGTLNLFERFNEPVKRLVDEWWPKIETSQKFADHVEEIRAYHRTLKAGDITLVGLIAEGGQGMRTANNARFLGYLEGTPQAQEVLAKREIWTRKWREDDAIRPVFEQLLKKNGGNPSRPTQNGPAWEACLESLRAQFGNEGLGLGKSDLYRIVPAALVAEEKDFVFTWTRRKAELFSLWKTDAYLEPFWQQEGLFAKGALALKKLRKAKSISDEDFCQLCPALLNWVGNENSRRKSGERIPKSSLGMRSSESYTDPNDAPRIATIYNGLSGRGLFVPFRKGDPEGNRWVDNEPLYIDWSEISVKWLFENSGHPESGMPVVRNAHLYFTPGITWTAVANHVAMKARFQDPCVFDADSMRLTPVHRTVAPLAFLALFNSDVLSYFKMKFLKHTQKWEIGDLRQLPVVMPTKTQEKRQAALAQTAIDCKRLTFSGAALSNEQTAFIRTVAQELNQHAPPYLRPPAQQMLLVRAEDGLAILELAVNWEAEKLYGVEGLGPFDEF
ncbi:MAG: hypothetical protein AB1512_12520 [Thermodesulfobacteriota bacterium]